MLSIEVLLSKICKKKILLFSSHTCYRSPLFILNKEGELESFVCENFFMFYVVPSFFKASKRKAIGTIKIT